MYERPNVGTERAETFAATAVRSVWRMLSLLSVIGAAVVHALAIGLDPMYFSPNLLRISEPSHVIYLVSAGIYGLTHRWNRLDIRTFALGASVIFTCINAYLMRLAIPALSFNQELGPSSCAFQAFAIMALILCPYGNRATYVVAVIFGVVGTIAADPLHFPTWPYVLTLNVAVGVSAYYHRTFIRLMHTAAVAGFRGRLAIAPASVVRQMARTGAPIEAAFEPRRRRCVCISSDWRGFQALTREARPEAVAGALTDYYTMCDALLSETIPRGNYVSDWFADELFVVIFPLDGDSGSDAELATPALAFARRLLAAKQEFEARHGLPAGIDIGMAAGETLLGMMGPIGFRKATALGETTRRARALQATGKELRQRFGDADRLICGEDVRAALGEAELTPAGGGLYWSEAA